MHRINGNYLFNYLIKAKEYISDKKEILLIWSAGFLLLIVLLNRVFPLPPIPEFSKVITDKNGALLSAYLSEDSKWRLRAQTDEVSPELIKAILEKEDRYYYYHPGVNLVSVARAIFVNTFFGRKRLGASTITMQLARMLDPSPRTYASKFKEIFRAFQLELHYSKEEILSLYLTLLPYGGNIEGVKAASLIYFGKPPSNLSLAEAVTLTVIPNDPNNLRPDRNNKLLREKRIFWLKYFELNNVFPPSQVRDAINEEIPSQRLQIQRKAPHLSDYLYGRRIKGDVIKTTIDQRIQSVAETILKNYINRKKPQGITNGAVLIIRNKDNSVAAYLGSADFNDDASFGQVNGIEALRSPGSALKPLLYAYAIDLGMLTPKMKTNDIPSNFGGYIPENFDMEFRGEVTVREALINSLNIPAVRLLQDIGVSPFVDLLIKNGVKELKPQKKKLGLSLILGGCGITLKSITNLFSVFPAGGKFRELKYYDGQKLSSPELIFTDGACYLISEMLSTNVRPDLLVYMEDIAGLTRIAWKTGTSFGKKDAWAIGYDQNYTIGVWVGNFDGTGSPNLSGAETATPLLFELFKTVSVGNKGEKFIKPPSAGIRDVCAISGKPPGRFCTKLIKDYYLINRSHNETCEAEKEFYVSSDFSFQYCLECLPDSGYLKKVYRIYDPELLLWMKEKGISSEPLPPHNPACAKVSVAGGPKIISPSPDFEYLIESNKGGEIMLQAVAEQGVRRLFWYVDNVFYGNTNLGEKIFIKPAKNQMKITCLDDRGRNSTIVIKVSFY